jgi:hypothetical protein
MTAKIVSFGQKRLEYAVRRWLDRWGEDAFWLVCELASARTRDGQIWGAEGIAREIAPAFPMTLADVQAILQYLGKIRGSRLIDPVPEPAPPPAAEPTVEAAQRYIHEVVRRE